ncbi:MAG: hypothetical protein ACOYXR_04290 [Nitrospirota bacterium]
MKRRVITGLVVTILGLLLNDPHWASAKEPYWEKYHIELSGFSEPQILALETTLNQLRALVPGDLRMNRRTYQRLSRFEPLFGFSFNGPDLFHWLLSRIHRLSLKNKWTVALNQNKGHFIVGDAFFTKLTPLERLYTLVHEARHSDDDGYDHVRCPKGFPYVPSRQPEMDLEKEPACDATNNGAYAFQSAFLFELFAYGLFVEQTDVGLLYNSSIARVMP